MSGKPSETSVQSKEPFSSRNDSTSLQGKLRSRRNVAGLSVPLLILLFLTGCGSSTQLETSEGVSSWALLRTACSAEDPARLEEAIKALDASRQSGKITEKEYTLLSEVAVKARDKDWQTALALCRDIHTLNL